MQPDRQHLLGNSIISHVRDLAGVAETADTELFLPGVLEGQPDRI